MACSPPDSSVHGIFQARILKWVASSFSKGSSQPRDRTRVSCIAGKFFATEPPVALKRELTNISGTNISIVVSGDPTHVGHPQSSHMWKLVFTSTALYDQDDAVYEMTLLRFVWERFCFLLSTSDFPGGSDGKSVCLQWGRPGFDPWAGKIPWRRKWQPTPVLLPWKSHGRRSHGHRLQFMASQRVGHNLATSLSLSSTSLPAFLFLSDSILNFNKANYVLWVHLMTYVIYVQILFINFLQLKKSESI